jgi:O-antigen/teichoic acid export membrane protein
MYGLNIEDELSQLQTSIERANSVEKSRRDKSINNVLTIIALLTVFSIIWDLSEWFNKIFFNSDSSYIVISVSLTIGVSILLLVFLLKNYYKNKKKWRRRRF